MRGWAIRWRRAPRASWRTVPRVNLLEGGGRRLRWVVRAGLALLLLGGLYLSLSFYQEGSAQQRELDLVSSRLRATEAELAPLRDEVDRLEAELGAPRERPLQQPGSERWRAALAALAGLQGDGVQFQSLEGTAGGELTAVAAAAGEQPLARLQARLQEADQPFELQGVQWGRDKEALTFAAILWVRASP